MDGLAIAAAISEMKQTVEGSVIRSVYQPSPTRFVWRLFSRGTIQLFIAPVEATIHLTRRDFAYPKRPGPFTMLLRKYLRGGRIVKIEQQGWDRVVAVSVEKRLAGELQRVEVIAELVGVQGNLIVVQDDVVVASLRPKARAVPGRRYIALPAQQKRAPTQVTEELIKKILEEKDNSRTLTHYIDGVGKELAKLIYEQAKKTASESFAGSVKRQLDCILKYTADPIGSYDTEQNSAFFFPVDGMEEYPSFSEALDRKLEKQEEEREVDEGLHEIRAAAKRAVAKTNKTIAKLEGWLDNAETANVLQHQADLLMIYQHEVPRKLQEISLVDPATNEDVTISVDPSRNGLENAQAMYERAKRLRRGRRHVEQRLKRLKEEVSLLEEGLRKVENGEAMQDDAAALIPDKLNKKKTAAVTAYRVQSIKGYTVRVGKNARQNDELLREANPDDLWLHVRDVPGSHVVISRQNKNDIPAEVIAAAARIAARHSKARHEKHVPVAITEVKHVRKPRGAPAGLVILQQEDTLVVDPSAAEEE